MKLPYKIKWPHELAPILLLCAAIIAGPILYKKFPEQIATHWNWQGKPDGYSRRAFAAFFFPALSAAIYLLMTFIPMIDPKKERYADFSKAYNVLRFSITALMIGIYAIISLVGLGLSLPVGKIMPIAIGFLFIILGNFLPKVKRNWFVGVRTPWTISSEEVWNKTHRVSGKIFVAAGLLFIIMAFLEQESLWWIVFLIVMAILLFGTTGYSWWVWKKIKK